MNNDDEFVMIDNDVDSLLNDNDENSLLYYQENDISMILNN